MPAKYKFFNTIFSAYYCLKLHLHHFWKIKSQKESQNSRNQVFSYYFCMMIEGSGSGFRSIPLTCGSGSGGPKTCGSGRIRIRIRNTGKMFNILQHSKILHIQEGPQRFLNLSHRLCLTSRQCCGSGMLIPDLGSWFVSNNSNKRENLLSYLFFYNHKFHKNKMNFIFEPVQKKDLSQLTKNYLYFLSKKLSLKEEKNLPTSRIS